MKKKIFGIKIGTVISVVLALIAAVLFWLFVGYSDAIQAGGTAAKDIIDFWSLV